MDQDSIGNLALTEGIKFLYAQAGELLAYWRKRRHAHDDEDAPSLDAPADAFQRTDTQPRADLEQLRVLSDELLSTRRALADYVDGVAEVDARDLELVAAAKQVRNIIAKIYHQDLFFVGETRTVPEVRGVVSAGAVEGDAAAVRIGSMRDGYVAGRADANTVTKDGRLTGVEINDIR